MQNIDVRFNATSNFGKVKADLAAVQAQAATLATTFTSAAYANTPGAVNPTGWKAASRAVHEASNAYRNAASSSGLLTAQQVRATSEAEKYTKALQKQKLSFADMRKHSGIMKQVYADQLRIQRMTAQYWGTDVAGRAITDITVPKNAPKDLDTYAQKTYFAGQMARSAGTQIVNMGKNMQWAGRQLTVGLTYPVTLFGAAAGVMAYKVDTALTAVAKVYDVSAEAQANEGLRTKELSDLRVRSLELAKKAARDYGQSIEETLGVEQALAATGLNGDKLFSSVDAVSRIATLGDLDLSQSTDMTIALQTAFRKTIKDAGDLTEAFDYMNAVENATSLSIKDIAEATPRAASAMSALGVNVKEMTVLLTSMRESGVEATEGANALKSATGTILAPSPAADKFIQQISQGKVQVTELAKASGGNLYEALRILSEQMEGLDEVSKQQILVKLFGKYQFNRVSAMLYNLEEAFDGTQNQTRKAMELMAEDAETLGKRSEDELGTKMEAVSGRFKAAWQEVRIELHELGMPFLEIATQIAEFTSKALGFFNGLSDGQKKMALLVASILGLAGPVIMLGGLFMNLSGQFMTGAGRIMSVLGRLSGARALMTTEEQTAALAAEAQNKAMMKQQSSASTLATEVKVLAAAYREATAAAQAYAVSQGITGAAGTSGPRPTTYSTPAGPHLPAAAPGAGAGHYSSAAARKAAIVETQKAEAMRLYQQEQINAKASREVALRQKGASYANATNMSMAAMAAGAAMMMGPFGETTANLGKWVMIGAVVVPALNMVVGASGAAAKNAWTTAAGYKAAAIEARALAVANGAAMGRGAAAAAVGKGLLTGIGTAIGPAGWATMGLVAIAGTFMAINSHQKKIKAEQKAILDKQLAANRSLQTSSRSIATNLGKAAGHYKQISGAPGSKGMPTADQALESYNYYRNDAEGKKELEGLKGSDGNLLAVEDLMDKVRTKYIDLQVIGGDTAAQARTDITAMLQAAGLGSIQSAQLAEDAFQRYGDVTKQAKKVDWTKPIKDQITTMNQLGDSILKIRAVAGAGTMMYTIEEDSNALAVWAQQGEKAAQMAVHAIATAASPQQARQIMDAYFGAATQKWDEGFKNLTDSTQIGAEKINALFKEYGITSGTEFSQEFSKNADFTEAYHKLQRDRMTDPLMAVQMHMATKQGQQFEEAFVKPFAKGSNAVNDDAKTVEAAMKDLNNAWVGMTFDEAKLKLFENEDYAKYGQILEQIADARRRGFGPESKEVLTLKGELKGVEAELLPVINLLLQMFGMKTGDDVPDAMKNLLNDIKVGKKETKDLGKELGNLPLDVTVNVLINKKEAVDIMKTSMENVQSQMADGAMDKFNGDWDASMEKVESRHAAAQDAMERKHEDAQEAFDARWEKRKEAVENAYQKRIDRVNREIEAEQKADDVRKRMFENEQARLQRAADKANTNIDFNKAVNEGNLDEAAKIANNAKVSDANAQMEAEQKAAELRTQARIDALEKKNKRLEEQRDQEVKNLEKMEERMRKHLQRTQEARADALRREQADYMKNLERRRNAEERLLQQKLELFKSFVPKNKKELDKWVKTVGFSYADFGNDVVRGGKGWADTIGKALKDEVKIAGTKVASDNMWKNIGKEMAKKMLDGWGFSNMGQFRKFVRSGKLAQGDKPETRHEGGVVGSGGGSRKGVAPTYKGLHRSEKMIRAQKGEYVVNKRDAAKHKPLLDAINSGTDVAPGEGGIGDGTGPSAMMGAAMANLFNRGAEKAMNNLYMKGLKKQAKLGSNYSGEAGTYGGRKFTGDQMKNAGIIASVGSEMGMSKRDIQIGIMTAIAESGLVNVDYGDRDSLGLFQQRPSMGWGTPKQLLNPRYAARAFFNPLKAHKERGGEAPWLAAQHIQRSAFSDGSNYQKWWEAAVQIYSKGLQSSGGGGGFKMGKGGKHRPTSYPVTSGMHGGGSAGNPPAVDMAMPVGKPLYAVADGVITSSRDIKGPLSSDRYRGDGPYGSFGRVVQMQTDSGAGVLYAHLSRRSVTNGQRVKGGSTIGYSGNTGNSSGPHLHFGATNGPYAWLRKGGEIKYDNTHVVAHRGETMLSAPVTRQLKENIASGGGAGYNVTIDLRGAYIKEDVDIEKAVNTAIDRREAKTGRNRVVR